MSSPNGYACQNRRSVPYSTPTQHQAQFAAALLSPTQHSFATHDVSRLGVENFNQSILNDYHSLNKIKLEDAMQTMDMDMETEHERADQIEEFVKETQAARANCERQVDVMKKTLSLYEEALSGHNHSLGKLAHNLSIVHHDINDLAERKEAALWLHDKNRNKPFAKDPIESVRKFLDLEAPKNVDSLTNILAVATLHMLENYGIGHRGGGYKKVETGKGSTTTQELHLRIKRLLEFDENSLPVAPVHTPNFNRAHGALSHAASGSGTSISSGESEGEEVLRQLRLRVFQLELELEVKSQQL